MYKKNQYGVGLIGALGLLGLLAVVVLLAVRLVPVYLEAFNVGSSVESLAHEQIAELADDEIKDRLMKRLNINAVSNVKKSDIIVNRDGNEITVAVRYEARTPILGNLDAVARFNKSGAVAH